MTMTDPIADMLTRIRNANLAGHDEVVVPSSKIKESIADILKEEGYISGFEKIEDNKQGMLKISMKYGEDRAKVINGKKIQHLRDHLARPAHQDELALRLKTHHALLKSRRWRHRPLPGTGRRPSSSAALLSHTNQSKAAFAHERPSNDCGSRTPRRRPFDRALPCKGAFDFCGQAEFCLPTCQGV